MAEKAFVSRAGQKLEHALVNFGIDVSGWVCADLGSNVGGFVDCLLQSGAKKVYAIDTGYGALEWKLRKDPRVVVMERTNAMHVKLPEPVKLVSIDVAWTKQKNILPAARRMIDDDGIASALVQGIAYYASNQDTAGLMHAEIAGYRVEDIEVVAAFDIDRRKVGRPLEEAIFAPPNNTKTICRDLPRSGVIVQMGNVLDGVAEHMREFPAAERFDQADLAPVDVTRVLRESR